MSFGGILTKNNRLSYQERRRDLPCEARQPAAARCQISGHFWWPEMRCEMRKRPFRLRKGLFVLRIGLKGKVIWKENFLHPNP